MKVENYTFVIERLTAFSEEVDNIATTEKQNLGVEEAKLYKNK